MAAHPNPSEGRLPVNWDAYWNGFFSSSIFEWAKFWPLARAYQKLLKHVALPKQSTFCELGAGTGMMSAYLAKKYHAHLALVDNNSKALHLLKKRFHSFPYPVEVIARDIFNLTAYRGQFDLVHSGGLIEHFTGDCRDTVIQAHCDLAKSQGFVIIFVPVRNRYYRFLNEGLFKKLHLLDDIQEEPWTADELEDSFRKYGFRIIAQTSVASELGVIAERQ